MTSRVTRRRTAAAALLAATVVGAVLTSSALFTDEETIDSNVFGVGTIDLSTSPTTQRFNVPNMMPGDVVTLPITIANDGDAELRYSMGNGVVAGDPELWWATTMDIRTGGTCTTALFGTTGALVAVPNSGRFGDDAQGQDPGDRVLAAGDNEVLCVQVGLPLDTDDTVQGKSVTVDFAFEAEQTANNP